MSAMNVEARKRVVQELRELSQKREKLERFLETTAFQELRKVSRELLKAQAKAMKEYEEILICRIDLDDLEALVEPLREG